MRKKALILTTLMTLGMVNYALACYCTVSCRTFTVEVSIGFASISTDVEACLSCNPAGCRVTFN
jgi:hypothetical protein